MGVAVGVGINVMVLEDKGVREAPGIGVRAAEEEEGV